MAAEPPRNGEFHMPVFRLFHLRLSDLGPRAAREAISDAMIDGAVPGAISLGLYDEVARIEALEIHDVFRLTNSIDEHWSANEGILACAPRCRSTMMGDLVLDERGVLHACARFGWDAQPDTVSDGFKADIGSRVGTLPEGTG
ncbi:hypothetical protein [Paracoccus sp. ME4]|uniref:hypothetical protein n=1 Tax=Paracoccus sp. ME4 TaxID=3138066 RepID=UPI00398BAD5B